MPRMRLARLSHRIPRMRAHYQKAPPMSEHEMQAPVVHDRSDDELEANSIKWNAARIVRLSSGRFALLTHYRAGALDIIKVGTLEEIAPHIPGAAECEPDVVHRVGVPLRKPERKDVSELLADLGL